MPACCDSKRNGLPLPFTSQLLVFNGIHPQIEVVLAFFCLENLQQAKRQTSKSVSNFASDCSAYFLMITSTAECSVPILQWQGGKVDSSIWQRNGFCCFVASNASMWPTLGCLLDGLVEASYDWSFQVQGWMEEALCGSIVCKVCWELSHKNIYSGRSICFVDYKPFLFIHSIHISAGTKKWTVGAILGQKGFGFGIHASQ